MNTLSHSPASRVGVVSYALALTVSARRIARLSHVDARPLVAAAVDRYRDTDNRFEGLRALRECAHALKRQGGGGLRA